MNFVISVLLTFIYAFSELFSHVCCNLMHICGCSASSKVKPNEKKASQKGILKVLLNIP